MTAARTYVMGQLQHPGEQAQQQAARPYRLFTDDEILEMRSRYEFEGWIRRQIMREYGLSNDQVKRYLQYTTAAHLVPRRPRQ